ncbi:MAG TPA: hypothetical protein VEK34_11170 [Methylocella sp.]|nr:hypothetical protein [Methylocella sp.]
MNAMPHYPEGVWLCDFEFHPDNGVEGNPPHPVCMVAREYFTGQTIRLWESDLAQLTTEPFPTDDSALFVAFYTSAEFGCFITLGWPTPANVLDLLISYLDK